MKPPKLHELIKELCRKHSGGRDPEPDLLNDVFAMLWERRDIPPALIEWFDQAVKKELQAARKRATRQQRRFPCVENPTEFRDGNDPSRHVDVADLIETLAADDFDRETLQVLWGMHPQGYSFPEYVRNQNHCCPSYAYKRQAKLVERVRQCADLLREK
jgi:hypothetical protein